MYNIEQYEHLTLLGVTTRFNWAFSLHVKAKLCEANKCLFIIRGLRREGYSQYEIDLLFKAIFLSKLTYGLPVYGASEADLNVIQFFLKRCCKRRYISELLDIRQMFKESDRKLFQKISTKSCHPLHSMLLRVKESSTRLRCNSSLLPKVNT